MSIGLISALLGGTTGAVWGIASGYYIGTFDMVSQRIVDTMIGFPNLILIIAIVAVLGANPTFLIYAIAIGFIPNMNRVMRSAALSVGRRQFIDAARAIGVGNTRIIFRHVAPNCFAPFLVIWPAEMGVAILAESSLSFLGLGTREPSASLGAMLSGAGQSYFLIAPWMAIWPGVLLSIAVFGFNYFGDALRDVLDPRLRRGRG